MNTIQYLDAAKTALDGASDYKLAKILGRQTSWIARFRANESAAFDDEACIRIAEILDIDPLVVIADMQLMKKRTNVDFWKRVKAKSAGTAAGVLSACLLVLLPHSSDFSKGYTSAFAAVQHDTTYYVKFNTSLDTTIKPATSCASRLPILVTNNAMVVSIP